MRENKKGVDPMSDEIKEEELEEELEEESVEEEAPEEPRDEEDEDAVDEALEAADEALDEEDEALDVESDGDESFDEGEEQLEADGGDGLADEQIGETTYEVEEEGAGGGGGGCASAILGSIVFFLIGLVLFPAACFTIYRAENVKKTSLIVQALPMTDVAQPPSAKGLVKFEGTPTGTPLSAKKANDKVWYYYYKYEREYVEKKIETERIKQGKKTIKKQTTKYLKVWKVDSSYSESKWVDALDFGKIKVVPSKNEKLYGTVTLKESGSVHVKGAPKLAPKTEGATGYVRYTVTGLKAEGPLLVVGVLENGMVEKGNDDDPKGAPFILARKSSEDLVKTLQTEEAAAKWGLRILTFILLYVGFIGIFNPFVKALEKIGQFGCGLDIFAKLFYLVDAMVSLFIVVVAIFFVNYFWFFMFLLFLGFVAVAFATHKALSMRKKG